MKNLLIEAIRLALSTLIVLTLFAFLPMLHIVISEDVPYVYHRLALEYCQSIGWDDGYYEKSDGSYCCGGGGIYIAYQPGKKQAAVK